MSDYFTIKVQTNLRVTGSGVYLCKESHGVSFPWLQLSVYCENKMAVTVVSMWL